MVACIIKNACMHRTGQLSAAFEGAVSVAATCSDKCCCPHTGSPAMLTACCVACCCPCRVHAAIAALFQNVCVRFLEERTDRALARCKQDETGGDIGFSGPLNSGPVSQH